MSKIWIQINNNENLSNLVQGSIKSQSYFQDSLVHSNVSQSDSINHSTEYCGGGGRNNFGGGNGSNYGGGNGGYNNYSGGNKWCDTYTDTQNT
ncbi:hypothetical protein DFA_08617 [Cavenderia fasciculata]|uniref:Uncharacterized protein n=1 Tax=Cavenderia fasciculata TaxID=261658 RepID=F4Q3B1_CACFS|nr:uncharacterized protein DFA_08617 [Cavenderia fasciculata]EGG17621.1 hypothetical protein DFA_08617 [Cavenderia fasciculata]|eukprot:XP_004356105.1 hypothetical protein DFA_08617 [Cavenderia fasciculata]